MKKLVVYHCSPSHRRSSIRRHGLLPLQARVTHTKPSRFLCFALRPDIAWRMSAGTGWARAKLFDMWEVTLLSSDRARIDPQHDSREVRVTHRIPPKRLRIVFQDIPTVPSPVAS